MDISPGPGGGFPPGDDHAMPLPILEERIAAPPVPRVKAALHVFIKGVALPHVIEVEGYEFGLADLVRQRIKDIVREGYTHRLAEQWYLHYPPHDIAWIDATFPKGTLR